MTPSAAIEFDPSPIAKHTADSRIIFPRSRLWLQIYERDTTTQYLDGLRINT